MGSTAQFQSFGPFFRNGVIVTAPRLFHYEAGTSNAKDAFLDRHKLSTAPQPIVGDANGIVSGHFDGVYKIVLTLADGITVIYIRDNFSISESPLVLEGTLQWNPGNLVDGAGVTSLDIPITGLGFGDFVMVAAPYDLQGVIATAYVAASGIAHIRLQNESGVAVDLADGQWSIRAFKA
jgi:hypothetical protein